MSAVWSLLRVQLKTGLAFTPAALVGGNRARLGLREWLLFGLITLSLVPLAGIATAIAWSMYGVLAQFGQPEAMLTSFVMAAVLLSLVFGVFYVISAFFYARDLTLLVPLPLSPSAVLGSKFAVVLVNEWISMVPLLGPPLVVYGVLAGPGWLYWPAALLVFLLTPVLPLAAAAMFALGLMRVIGRSRQRDWLLVVGTLLATAIAVSLQFVTQGIGPGMTPERVQQMVSDLVGYAGRLYPPAVWATRALAPDAPGVAGGPWAAPGALALVVLASAAGLGVMWLAARGLFYRGLRASMEAPVRRALGRGALAARLGRARPALGALVWREWAILWRTPMFTMNTLLPMVLVPAIFGGMWLTMGRIPDAELRALVAMLERADVRTMGPLLAVGASAGMSLFGMLGASAVSREGRQFWISRLIPVPPRAQVVAKVTFAAGAGAAGSVLIGVPIGLLSGFSPWGWLYWLAGTALVSVGLAALELCVDLWRPKLNWTDPQVAIKQNFNVVLALVAAVAATVAGGAVVRWAGAWGWRAAWAALLVYAALVAAAALAGALALAPRAYRRVEM